MNEKNIISQGFGFMRKIVYFKEWAKLDFKFTIEYKINFISTLIFTFSNFLITLFILFILNNIFIEGILWSKEMFLFYVFNGYAFSLFFSTFIYGRHLSRDILLGTLNNYLVRPTPVFLQYLLSTSRLRRLFVSFLYFIGLIFIVYYYSMDLSRFLISIIFSIFAGVFSVSLYVFLDSMAFIIKDNSYLKSMYVTTTDTVMMYPFAFFKDASFSKFLLIVPTVYMFSFPTEYVFGFISLEQFLLYFLVVFLLILIFIIGIYLLWYYGLKKYEAFG